MELKQDCLFLDNINRNVLIVPFMELKQDDDKSQRTMLVS